LERTENRGTQTNVAGEKRGTEGIQGARTGNKKNRKYDISKTAKIKTR